MKCTDLHTLFATSPQVMTPNEVCAIIRASDSHLYRLIGRDCLPCFRVGTHYRLLKEDVVRCLERETCPHG